MKRLLILAIASLIFVALPSCSKSDSKLDLEYTTWRTAADNTGYYEGLHFMDGWCTWSMFFKSGTVTQEYKYHVKGNTIELSLDKRVFYVLTYNQSNNTITVTAEGEFLTFIRS